MDDIKLLRGKPIFIEEIGNIYPLTLGEIEDLGENLYDLFLRLFRNDADYYFQECNKDRDFSLYMCWALSLVLKTDVVYKSNYFLTKENKIITKDDYEKIIEAVRMQNLLGKPLKKEVYADDRARKIAEKIKSEKSKYKTDNNIPTLKDLISCVCAKSGSYNLLNIWDLTIYQLYDQFTRLTMIDNYQSMVFLLPYSGEHGGKNLNHWSISIKEDE